MGHSSSREPTRREFTPQTSSQFSIANLFGSSSGRSLASVASNQTACSAQRPWSRVSRRRWNDSTLSSPLEASKTVWPVPRVEALFLPEFPISTQLQHRDFTVQQTVARGAYGEVYRVRKEAEEKDYALKVLSKAQVVREDAVRQVKEEAKIQELCGHHTFIVGAVSRWQTRRHLYIVSEYIPGGELLALLERYRKLPEDLVRVYVAELALALDFLHNAGVIYRDLKPENILLDSAGHLQLIDFGLSKWLSRGARTYTLCGTFKYMAPEILSGHGYTHAVDWWSLGVVMCRMLTDEYPSPAARLSESDEGASAVAVEPASRPGSLPMGTELSDAARKLLVRLLDVEPQRRLRSLRELQQTAFYMAFDFDHVRAGKISPKSFLEENFPPSPPNEVTEYANRLRTVATASGASVFTDFDRATIV